MTRTEFEARLISFGLRGRVWGRAGPRATLELSRFLQKELPTDFTGFVEGVGNATIGPFHLVVAGSDDGSYSALTETRNLVSAPTGVLKVMEHAGEVYLYYPQPGTVRVYESSSIQPGAEILQFGSFAEFLDWLFKEARASIRDSRFE